MQHKGSYGAVTMVTDEGEDEEWHGAELLSTGSNTGRGSGEFLRRGVSWGESVDNASTVGERRVQDLKGTEQDIEFIVPL